ncbi:DUF3558 domain-containing protein [Saccharothrix deserti]|uniref:DUF3558 domain-containing protein n=1 Tax=Saccharothrix deserti TaxID=2593674 RepID=UPI00131B4A96|nr:DUF3558 domain-containing protein [Saccharothrix deserti]
MRRAVLAVVSAASLALAAGCTSVGGSPTAAETTSATSTSTGSTDTSEASGKAPAITGPELDLSKFSGPCDMLTSAQLSARGVTKAGEERAAPTGRGCDWTPDDRAFGTSFGATFLTESKGLDGFYQNRDDFAVFEPTEVAGYPAVNSDLIDIKSGSCSTAVGVAKGEGFVVQINVNDKKLPEYGNPCSVSSAIAETVIGNLRG